ncbi:hypothetical protein EMIHUDRAFT_451286 [Emiliania huxleyi CCMP1516]|uniref:Uncharacterized protein n=2 Tax=Emiliania huxleyi TaxID=2903 RepID=A0A0D3J2H1_EMIH1|nr:hypothetical protein EMIHUDRAFT_451286 [Emiliania huxleyi CCMP1516]EOD17706.1 hypothetical protein EMIHUDRAFT_451286 [Emiliania huxleyi CCMP1516]|eukprot:XP_005770135.1 hypothetical protein EMIHUDRAFT_451286 [Emiliania huxleyi CCMP1516]
MRNRPYPVLKCSSSPNQFTNQFASSRTRKAVKGKLWLSQFASFFVRKADFFFQTLSGSRRALIMAASGSSRRKKKAPGSLLNKLFALGCLASLLPLYYEYHYTTRSREHLPHVPHDDPFIRVIDAAGPFDEPGINHSTVWRHHPRHRVSAAVSSLGGAAVEEDAEGESRGPEDKLSASAASAASASASAAASTAAATAPAAAAALAKAEPGPANASTARISSPAAVPVGGTGSSANASAPRRDDADDEAFLRAADAAADVAAAARQSGSRNASRIWRVVPGGVRDVVETLPGGGSRTWVIEDAPRPQFEKGEWVSDGAHKLGPQARRELQVLVAPRCSGLLSESHALHFSRKARREAALKLSFYVAFMFRSRAALSMLSMRFLSLAMMRFVLASNELAMMLFMLASMNAAKREQQRRLYALHGLARRAELALHGYDEHGRPLRRGPLGSSAPLYASLAAYPELGVRREAEAEAFWDSFESGRRGRLRTYDEGPHGLLLQILALDEMLTRLREGQDGDFSDSATGDESDEDDRRSPSPDR